METIDVKRALEIVDVMKSVGNPSYFHYNNLITQKLQEAVHSKIRNLIYDKDEPMKFTVYDRHELKRNYVNMNHENELFKYNDNWSFGRITAPSSMEEINRCEVFTYCIDDFYYFYTILECLYKENCLNDLLKKAGEDLEAAEQLFVDMVQNGIFEEVDYIVDNCFCDYIYSGEREEEAWDPEEEELEELEEESESEEDLEELEEESESDKEIPDEVFSSRIINVLSYGLYGALLLYYYMNNKEYPYEDRLRYFDGEVRENAYLNILEYMDDIFSELEHFFHVQDLTDRCQENEDCMRFLVSCIMNCIFSRESNYGDGYSTRLLIIGSKILGEYALLKEEADREDAYNKQLMDALDWLYDEITSPMGFESCEDFMASRMGGIGSMDSFISGDTVYIVLHYMPYVLEEGLENSGFLDALEQDEYNLEWLEEKRKMSFDFTYRLKTELFDVLLQELKCRLPENCVFKKKAVA